MYFLLIVGASTTLVGHAMRDVRIRVLVVLSVSGAITVVAALLPALDLASRAPTLRAALDTAPPLIALVAGFVVLGRLLRWARLSDLALVCSLGALALSELALVSVPVLAERFRPDLSVWAALAGSAFGAALFAVAAFVPRRTLRRPRLALSASGAGVAATLLMIALLASAFAARLPKVPAGPTAPVLLAGPDLRADAALPAVEITLAAIYGLAAVGFLRRSERFHDEFYGWLAVAAVLSVAAHVNYFLYPRLYAQFVSIGDVFLVCFYAVLLAGSARELWSHWRALSEAAVLEERRRIARDLHDGPAQELAYLLRNLDSLNGMVDKETKAHLRRAAERAQLEVRLAIDTFAAAHSQSVNVAVAQAVGEVAARDHITLELDIVPGIRLSAARADALVRIAREAVGNAARHSGAARVSLNLQRRGSRVRLRVTDDGTGFDPVATAGGFGLTSMRERASLVGGDLWISSAPGRGTQVEAVL
jgi:signal transduction histidine kinase